MDLNYFYNIKLKSINGSIITMNHYKNKTLLIVNTASKCGFTNQYLGLEELYKKYNHKGLEILGFPCNQFANQEPEDEINLINGCLLDYNITFDMFSKIDVNGKNAHPLYVYLKNELPGFLTNSIKWNFTKFLIAKDGTPTKRFSTIEKPNKIDSEIQKIL